MSFQLTELDKYIDEVCKNVDAAASVFYYSCSENYGDAKYLKNAKQMLIKMKSGISYLKTKDDKLKVCHLQQIWNLRKMINSKDNAIKALTDNFVGDVGNLDAVADLLAIYDMDVKKSDDEKSDDGKSEDEKSEDEKFEDDSSPQAESEAKNEKPIVKIEKGSVPPIEEVD